jgi:hypothetical protein
LKDNLTLIVHPSIPCIWFNRDGVNQQMHTLRKNHNNVLLRKFLQVSGLTGSSTTSAQLYKRIVQTFYNSLCNSLK